VSAMSSSVQTDCKCDLGYTGPDGGGCEACVAGKFKASSGSIECTQCGAGKYSSSTAVTSDVCSDCGVNFYTLDDNSQCVPCPADTSSASSSAAQMDCKCNAGYTGPDGGVCTACVAGKFKVSSGSAACTQCEGGKYSASTAATLDSCGDCRSNYFSSADNSICESCPPNTGSPALSDELVDCICHSGYTGPDGEACTACAAGKFKVVSGSAACTQCEGGKHSAATGSTSDVCADCSQHFYSSADNSQCVACPSHSSSETRSSALTQCICNSGFTGPNGGDCVACEAGTYKTVRGTVACTLCGSGKYSTASAATSPDVCGDCPRDTNAPPGSDELEDCTCNVGHTGRDGRACSNCPAGKYKSVTGSAPCTMCVAGKHILIEESTAVSACTDCPAGTYSASDRSKCKACTYYSTSAVSSGVESDCNCNAGYTGPDGGPCVLCTPGYFKSTLGSSSCTECGAGKYATEYGAVSVSMCQNCAMGTYSAATGASSLGLCTACPARSGSPAGSDELTDCTCDKGYRGADGAACGACPRGTYKDVIGSSSCMPCAIGRYIDRMGATVCLHCPEGSSTLQAESDSIADCVCSAGYTGLEGQCQACPKGKFKPNQGSEDCAWCTVDTYSDFSAATACSQCPVYSTNYIVGSLNRSWDRQDCKCFPGYTRDSRNPFECAACAAGTWKVAMGLQPCTKCQAGKYSSEVAALTNETCTFCPRDSSSPAGSGELTDCICNPGFTNPPGTNCSKCVAGTYKPEQGPQNCSLCGQGKFSGRIEQTQESTCELCPRGTLSIEFGASSNATCQPCPAGTYMPAAGATACLQCPDKSESLPRAYSVSECKCIPGYSGPNGVPCSPCPAGTYKDVYGSGPCALCPPNSRSPPGSSSATLCACSAGFTGLDDENGFACVLCGDGFYRASASPSEPDCIACPPGSTSEAGSTDLSECVCQADYTLLGGSCSKCVVGKAPPLSGTGKCVFPASDTPANSTIKAELKLTGITKVEFLSSIDDFKANIASSVLSSEDAEGLEWGADQVVVIAVCVGTECTILAERRGARRQSGGDEITVEYTVSVPNGVSPDSLAAAMADPNTVKTFESKMSASTGRAVGAKYEKVPSVSSPALEQPPTPFHETLVFVIVLGCSLFVLVACSLYWVLRVTYPKAFVSVQPLPHAHFSITLHADSGGINTDSLRRAVADDLSAAIGLDHKNVLIVALRAGTPKVEHGGSSDFLESNHTELHDTASSSAFVSAVHFAAPDGDAGKAAGEHRIPAVRRHKTTQVLTNGILVKVHLHTYDTKQVAGVVSDLLMQCNNKESILMHGKFTRYITRIDDKEVGTTHVHRPSKDDLVDDAEAPVRMDQHKVPRDYGAINARLRRWQSGINHKENSNMTRVAGASREQECGLASLDEFTAVDMRPTTNSGRPRSSFLLSGFNLNHVVRERRVMFADNPSEMSVAHSDQISKLLQEAEDILGEERLGRSTFVKAEPPAMLFDDELEMWILRPPEDDPEPFAKPFRDTISGAPTAHSEQLASTAKASRTNQAINGFSFAESESALVDTSSVSQDDRIGQRSDILRKVQLAPFNWMGLAKEKELRRNVSVLLEDPESDQFEQPDGDDVDDLLKKISHELPHEGVQVSLSPPSEIQALLKMLGDDDQFGPEMEKGAAEDGMQTRELEMDGARREKTAQVYDVARQASPESNGIPDALRRSPSLYEDNEKNAASVRSTGAESQLSSSRRRHLIQPQLSEDDNFGTPRVALAPAISSRVHEGVNVRAVSAGFGRQPSSILRMVASHDDEPSRQLASPRISSRPITSGEDFGKTPSEALRVSLSSARSQVRFIEPQQAPFRRKGGPLTKRATQSRSRPGTTASGASIARISSRPSTRDSSAFDVGWGMPAMSQDGGEYAVLHSPTRSPIAQARFPDLESRTSGSSAAVRNTSRPGTAAFDAMFTKLG
jgi:hypothetical protein